MTTTLHRDIALPTHDQLVRALREAQADDNGGLGNHMWAVLVDRLGVVTAVAYSGETFGDQWPGSRIIAAQKANTANAFSTDSSALSTANLYAGVPTRRDALRSPGHESRQHPCGVRWRSA